MPEIEYLLLADHVDASSGKLNALGAGWTDLSRVVGTSGPPVSHFGIGVSVLIPWTETNRRHHLVVRIEHEDGEPLLGSIEADLEVGRPPGLPHGADQRAVLAMNADIQFPRAGGHRVVADLGDQMRSASFRVHDKEASG
jgi:hypothetical protein